MVMFDLPVVTKTQRKAYTKFHKDLLKGGFSMWQFSVYVRHCASEENGLTHINRVERLLPKKGKVSILTITEKQMSAIRTYWGRSREDSPDSPSQLEMF
jgi:CRISPR-associated protein Cas2